MAPLALLRAGVARDDRVGDGVPGTAVAVPSVLVIARSAVGTSVSVSVAELFAGFGSVTPAGVAIVAVLLSVPTAAAETVPVTVNVAVPPGGRLTPAAILPDPDAGHAPPPPPTHVHVAPRIAAGSVSATVAPTDAARPGVARDDRVRDARSRRDRRDAVGLGDREIGHRRERVGVGRRVVAGVRIDDGRRGT